jgi:uncharacterized protein YbcV (DUF1398 family)
MTPEQKLAAVTCLNAAETDALDFPAIVGQLIEAGFVSYTVDLRRARCIYYLPDGDSIELPLHAAVAGVSAEVNAAALRAAILQAQTKTAGYTYAGFCRKIAAAGCSGYTVSFTGRRAVYSGRTAEMHVELFPD